MKRVLWWISGVGMVGMLATGAFVLLMGAGGPLAASIAAQTPLEAPIVTLRAADTLVGQISASGSIAPVEIEHVVLEVDGAVQEVLVEAGDVVTAGAPLLRLDTSDLELAVLQAKLDVATAQNTLAQLQEQASATELAEARADLESAQRKLEDARKPATATEIAAARANVAAAWAKYNDLKAGASADERVKLEANLRKAEVAMQEAQRNYDKIKWAGDAGMTAESAALQKATIDYEAAKADYAVASAPADEADLQSAISQAHDAQQQLADLLARPDAAEVAAAEAQVAAAQTRLDDLLQGASDLEIEAATIKLQSALVTLGEARRQLAKATLTAPSDGSVLTVSATKGAQARAGAEAATLADLTQLKLTVYVAEVDVNKVALQQSAEVAIDALPGRSFSGTVTRIAPVNSGGSGAVSYAVTLALAGDLSGVLPDMTAVARFRDESLTGGWLAPTTALQRSGDATTLPVLRDGVVTQISVTTGAVQGEWTVIYADALREGDQVVGAVRIPSAENRGGDAMMIQRGGFPPRPPQGFGGE